MSTQQEPCRHDLPLEQCGYCTPPAQAGLDEAGTPGSMTYYANPDADGNPRMYRTHWDNFPTDDGRFVDIELIGPVPADPVPGGQPRWPLGTQYRVRPAGDTQAAWQTMTMTSYSGGTFGAKARAACFGEAVQS